MDRTVNPCNIAYVVSIIVNGPVTYLYIKLQYYGINMSAHQGPVHYHASSNTEHIAMFFMMLWVIIWSLLAKVTKRTIGV